MGERDGLPVPELLSVPVGDGDLTVARWGSGSTVVVAPHGITANHVSWTGVAAELGDEVTLLAPDLRGRGGSAHLGPPFGMATHAQDCVAILDHVGAETGILAGHSMGGFVAVKAGSSDPDRWSSLILIDGGIGLPIPEGLEIDQVLHAVIGPAMERLEMSFGSRQEYRDYWRAHPAFRDAWSELVQRYVDYDIEQIDGGAWASKVRIDAIREDGRGSLVDESLLTALERCPMPVRFVRAQRGLMNGDPLYPQELVETRIATKDDSTLRDASEHINHYTLLLSEDGAAVVAAEIRAAIG